MGGGHRPGRFPRVVRDRRGGVLPSWIEYRDHWRPYPAFSRIGDVRLEGNAHAARRPGRKAREHAARVAGELSPARPRPNRAGESARMERGTVADRAWRVRRYPGGRDCQGSSELDLKGRPAAVSDYPGMTRAQPPADISHFRRSSIAQARVSAIALGMAARQNLRRPYTRLALP